MRQGRGVTQENWGRPQGGTNFLVDSKSDRVWRGIRLFQRICKPRSRRSVDNMLKPETDLSGFSFWSGAGRGNRTPTGLLSPADFKSAASASFAIPALWF